jgi:uncharacterized protein YcaQ
VEPHRLSLTDARRIAVRAQLLSVDRPTDLVATVGHLTLLQIDPTAAIAPAADLVAWSRLGNTYSPDDLRAALDERQLFEYRATVRERGYFALLRGDMAEWPGPPPVEGWRARNRDWVADNDACRRDILRRLDKDGPLRSRDLPDTCVRPWGSSGWRNNRNVTQLLDFMADRGEIAVAGRAGRDRLWDLASRVLPVDDDDVPSPVEAAQSRDQRRLIALGIARAAAAFSSVEETFVGTAGEPAVVDGVRGAWRVDPAQLGQPFSGRTALLSPFDRLALDRKRAAELFGFDYQLEMYKPAPDRRWGYYALPILSGDRLVGKLDATADRRSGVLHVHAIHEDEPLDPSARMAVDDEIDALAAWLGLEAQHQ